MHYHRDHEQIQLIKDWWKKNGNILLLFLAVYVATNFAWHYWHKHTTENNERASMVYFQLLEADKQNKEKEVTLYIDDLLQDYPTTSYASFSGLIAAKYDVSAGKLDKAEEHLMWVIKHGKQSSLRQIARIRAARVFLAENKFKEALRVLKHIDDKAFMSAIAEIRGDIYSLQNEAKKAAKYYKHAVDALPSEVQSPFLIMKYKQFESVE